MMKRLALAALLTLITLPAFAQGVAVSVRNGLTNPPKCSPSSTNVFINRTGTPTLNICTAANTWTGALSLAGGTVTGAILPSPTNTVSLGGASNFFKDIRTGRIIGGAATPTLAGTGFGATPTLVFGSGSSDLAGIYTATVGGAGPAATGTATITFSTTNGAYGPSAAAVCVGTLVNNTGTWNARASLRISVQTAAAVEFTWDNNAVAVTNAQIYQIAYICIGK